MANLKIPVSDIDHRQGNPTSKVSLVEYGDYECPYCGEAYWLVKKLQEHFQEDLQFVFRNFPLTKAHPHAMNAAITAEFVGHHGFYWEAHDVLYENQHQLGLSLFKNIALKHGLSGEELDSALQNDTYISRIKSDFNGGVRSGVNGTPSFYIDGKRYDGPPEYEEMRKAIQFAIGSGHDK